MNQQFGVPYGLVSGLGSMGLPTTTTHRIKGFVEDGAVIGDMPVKEWLQKGTLGFRKAMVIGYRGRAVPIDQTR